MSRYSDSDLDALKSRNPVEAVAGETVKLRAVKHGEFTFAGPCPICSRDPQKRSATKFECNSDKWVCAACPDGGDVIRLVRKRDGIGFS